MRNRIAIFIFASLLLASCGTVKKAADNQTQTNGIGQTDVSTTVTTSPSDAVIAKLGEWQTMQTGGNIALKGSNNFSSSMQMRMVKDKAIIISLRPMLGIEVGKLLITGDSLYAVDKVHKRYIAEKVSLLTAGIPVTVSDVQDIFLGRPFIIGQGTLNKDMKDSVEVVAENGKVTLCPQHRYKGYSYAFTFDKESRIMALNIIPGGSTTPAYKVAYTGVKNTSAGNIAHNIDVNATVEKKKLAFSISYKNIDWDGSVKIDRSIPSGYKRMSAADLFSLFKN